LYFTSLKHKVSLPLVHSEPVHLEQAKTASVRLLKCCPHVKRRYLLEDSRNTAYKSVHKYFFNQAHKQISIFMFFC